MTEAVFMYICYGGAILAALMFITTIILFFVLKIPHVIGDLSGANARKAIENIRNQNESTGEKIYKSSETNIKRGKITDKISPSGNLIKNPSGDIAGAMKTEKISPGGYESVSNETTVLDCSSETTVLNPIQEETTVLNTNQGETTVLEQPSVFVIEYEITFVHTSEVITV